jgi:hypothetical protein
MRIFALVSLIILVKFFVNCTLFLFLYLTLSKPIFLPTAYFPALIFLGRERGWWITCNYPIILKEKNRETERVQPALSVG